MDKGDVHLDDFPSDHFDLFDLAPVEDVLAVGGELVVDLLSVKEVDVIEVDAESLEQFEIGAPTGDGKTYVEFQEESDECLDLFNS